MSALVGQVSIDDTKNYGSVECGPNVRRDIENALKCYGSNGAAKSNPTGIGEVIVEFQL